MPSERVLPFAVIVTALSDFVFVFACRYLQRPAFLCFESKKEQGTVSCYSLEQRYKIDI